MNYIIETALAASKPRKEFARSVGWTNLRMQPCHWTTRIEGVETWRHGYVLIGCPPGETASVPVPDEQGILCWRATSPLLPPPPSTQPRYPLLGTRPPEMRSFTAEQLRHAHFAVEGINDGDPYCCAPVAMAIAERILYESLLPETAGEREPVAGMVMILVNGREYSVRPGYLTFAEVVRLFCPVVPDGLLGEFRVRFEMGLGHRPEGAMPIGSNELVVEGMRFRVALWTCQRPNGDSS